MEWPDELDEVIYIDTYGNLMTGLRACGPDDTVAVNGQAVPMARTFSDVPVGKPFHYGNSIGLSEIAVNCGRADRLFDAEIGTKVCITPANLRNP